MKIKAAVSFLGKVCLCLVFGMSSGYGQPITKLRCENFASKWEVTIDFDTQLIFTQMQVDGVPAFVDAWRIVQSGDRFIRGNFIEVDKRTKKTTISDRLSVLIDRYDSKLLWGDLSDNNKTPLQFDCVKVDRKF